MTTQQQPLAPITKLAESLVCNIELTVRGFTRYHKYNTGALLREQAMAVARVCNRAWRDRQRQAYWVNELVFAIDELKFIMQMGSRLHAFKSFSQFEQLIRAAEELGRRVGGWKRQHLKGQNPARGNAPERAKILSDRDASASAGAKT